MPETPRICLLSPAVIASLPTTGERYAVRDTEVRGLAVRVYPTGTKVYTLDYRVAGDRAKHRISLGTFPDVSLAKARSAARAAKVSATTDRRNPAQERADAAEQRRATATAAREARAAQLAAREAERHAKRERTRHTVHRLALDYLRDRRTQLGHTTALNYSSTITRYLTGTFGQQPISALTQSSVRELLRTVQEGTPPKGVPPAKGKPRKTGGESAARSLRQYLSCVWHYAAEEREIVSGVSPVPGAAKLGLLALEKERFLTPAECAQIMTALDTAVLVGLTPAPKRVRARKTTPSAKHRPKSVDIPIPANPVAVAAIRFALHTGWRRSEVLTLQWGMLRRDLGTVILPATKTGESVRAPSQAAWELLERVPRVVGSPYVFPSPRCDGRKPLGDVSRLWDAVRHAAGVRGTRFHDLRHTAASLAINAGATLEEVRSMLGHLSARTTMRYAKLIPTTGLRASEKLSGALAAAQAAPVATVTPITRASSK